MGGLSSTARHCENELTQCSKAVTCCNPKHGKSIITVKVKERNSSQVLIANQEFQPAQPCKLYAIVQPFLQLAIIATETEASSMSQSRLQTLTEPMRRRHRR